MSEVWTVKLTDSGYYGYNSAPIVVGDVVYITTIENDLAGTTRVLETKSCGKTRKQ